MSAVLVHDFKDLVRLGDKLDAAAKRLDDATPLLDDIGAALDTSTRGRFDTQTDPFGRRWRALSADTVIARMGGVKRVYTKKMRYRKGVANKMSKLRILFVQGHLRNSITHHVTRTGVEVGSNLVYAALHQFGGQAGRGHNITVPARPYLGLSSADRDMIEGLAQDYLARAVQ